MSPLETPTSVDEIFALFALNGTKSYGEGVDMTTHAIQTAVFAQRDGASDALVAASLLHDIGHLMADLQGTERFDLEVDDDDHEALGGRVLSPIFGPRVAQPVALHVTAKRWRCTVEPSYHDGLSPTSQATLKAQGGLLNSEEVARFEAHPGFDDAVALRTYDDRGKDPDMETPSLESFRPLLEKLAASR